MKCFVHIEKEAIAACRQCGKGMCEDCSAYSGHTGICPECRLKEFKAEVAQKLQENKELKRDFILRIVKSVLLFWLLLIPVLVGLVVCLKLNKQMNKH